MRALDLELMMPEMLVRCRRQAAASSRPVHQVYPPNETLGFAELSIEDPNL
jgi:hypothetical protein